MASAVSVTVAHHVGKLVIVHRVGLSLGGYSIHPRVVLCIMLYKVPDPYMLKVMTKSQCDASTSAFLLAKSRSSTLLIA